MLYGHQSRKIVLIVNSDVQNLQAAIAALEMQRPVLGDAVVEAALSRYASMALTAG